MNKFLVICVAWIAFQSHASLDIYGVGSMGIFGHYTKESSFIKIDKYSGGLGLQYRLLPFLFLGAELEYTRGNATYPKPLNLTNSPQSYGVFSDRGVNFVTVNYYELWLRPKVVIPLPFVKPYLVVPLSPLSYGGMQGYSSYGVGVGALAGIEIDIFSFSIFAESGLLLRARQGTTSGEGPPWGMLDLTVPIRLGLGYSF